MTAKQEAKNIFNEAWQFAPSSGATKDAAALKIAQWNVNRIINVYS